MYTLSTSKEDVNTLIRRRFFESGCSPTYIAVFALKKVIMAPKENPFLKVILISLVGYPDPTPVSSEEI
jgi:hypothetical protein